MIEHRLIERAVPLMQKEIKRIEKENSADCDFIVNIVDFFRTYADRCHHGKEEDILFAELCSKKISAEHKKILNELISEHICAREAVGKLLKAREAYLGGSTKAVDDIKVQFKKLIDLYPEHIAKEDKHFFIPVMAYFDQKEQDAMLDKMMEFDRKLIHEKYGKIIQTIEKSGK